MMASTSGEKAPDHARLDGEVDILRDVARDARNLNRVELPDHDTDDPAVQIEQWAAPAVYS